MPSGMSLGAKLLATAMFREIGVNVRMRSGVLGRDLSDSCGTPIVIQFEDGLGYHGSARALAYALPYKKSGTCIHVFLDRVLHLTGDQGFASTVLAHVMVHEITHVLEQSELHSAEGVMKAFWSDDDYERMKRHPLPFSPEDVDLIRERLAGRITHAAAD
jgi:hypothetical protein